MNALLTGNEAVARGAYEAGAKVASGYPGTPVTEVMEYTMNNYNDIYCEWSTNEKVALEVAMGASFAGYRSFSIMKTVGLNVAHDSLMAAVQAKTNGGLVIVVADDVGRISDDHNDCRYFGDSTGIPILEPSDSSEAKEFMKLAFEISEQYSIPVMLRLTSVTCKTSSLVDIDEAYKYCEVTNNKYENSYYGVFSTTFMLGMKNCSDNRLNKYKHNFVEKVKRLAVNSERYNHVEINNKSIGIITAGVAYCYVKEVMPDASILKLGLINPLPDELIKNFSKHVDKLYVIEEGQDVLEKNIKSIGVHVIGKELFPKFPHMTSFTPDVIEEKLSTNVISIKKMDDIPFRLPSNCAGCSHLFVFNVLKKHRLKATTDVTCGGLGVLPHVNAFCNGKNMGASIGMVHGYNLVAKGTKKHVAVIGDGGFWATGINGIINLNYNRGRSAVIIVDNGCIAMTGGQSLPSGDFGINYTKENKLDIAETCRSLGIEDVVVVDPYNIEDMEGAILHAVESDTNSIVVVKKECVTKLKAKKMGECKINQEKCVKCKQCLNIGCLAIEGKEINDDFKVHIASNLCRGCKLCATVCPMKAIEYNEQ